jgi:NhaP-type Na+/H+ or K+/H+ antiporter
MESLILGIVLGFVAGYMVRAMISQVRRRRFEEDYGFNPRSRLRPRP